MSHGSRSRFTLVAPLLVLLASLPACGGDDSPSGGVDVPDTPAGEAALVALDGLSVMADQGFLGAYVEFLPAPKAPKPAQCSPLTGACSAGSAEFCPDETGGVVSFSSCNSGGAVVNGSIHVVGSPTSGYATVDLTIGNLQLQFSPAYSINPETGCLSENFTPLTVTSTDGVFWLAGFMEYCNLTPQQGEIIPTTVNGTGYVTLASSTQFGINIYDDESSSNPEDLEMSVATGDFSQTLLYCSVNLRQKTLSCESP